MATNYPLNFTDQNPNKDLLILENKFYGQASPVSQVQAIGAIDNSKVSLTLYGKNTPNYGEKVQENILYLLENFAGVVEPAFPIAGQLWFDRNSSGQLKVFNSNKYSILSSVLLIPSASSGKFQITINGTSDERDRLISLISKNIIVLSPDAVNNPNVVGPGPYEKYISASINTSGVTFIDPVITIVLDVFDGTLTDLSGWFIGGWDNVLQGSDTQNNFNAIGKKVINAADPVNPQDLTTLKFVTDITNQLSIDINNTLIAANAYTDQEILTVIGSLSGITQAAADIRYVNVTGDSMTGNLNFTSGTITNIPDPLNPFDAATKNYVDNILNPANYYDSAESNLRFVQIGTPEISKPITISSIAPDFFEVPGDATGIFGAGVPFVVIGSSGNDGSYTVDVGGPVYNIGPNTTTIPLTAPPVNIIAGGNAIVAYASNSVMGGFLSLYSNPTAAMHAATKQYVDTAIAGVGGGGGGSSTLAGLTDVTFGIPISGDFLNFNGIEWINSSFNTLFNTYIEPVLDTQYLKLSGGTVTGATTFGNTVTLSSDPLLNLEAATKQYVDGLIPVPAKLISGVFNEPDLQLDLTRQDAVTITVPFGPKLSNMLDVIDEPNQQVVFTTVAAQTIYNLSNYGNFVYKSGFNRILVFKDGLKLIPSKKASISIKTDTIIPFHIINSVTLAPDTFVIPGNQTSWLTSGETFIIEGSTNNNGFYTLSANSTFALGETTVPVTTPPVSTTADGQLVYTRSLSRILSTGFVNATTYEFNISVDGAPDILVSIIGSDAQTINDLEAAIKQFFIINTIDATIDFDDNFSQFTFKSHLGGATSSIIINEVAVTNPLWTSMLGTNTNPIKIDGAPTWTSPAVVDRGYYEFGATGLNTNIITFHTAPPAGETVEVINTYSF